MFTINFLVVIVIVAVVAVNGSGHTQKLPNILGMFADTMQKSEGVRKYITKFNDQLMKSLTQNGTLPDGPQIDRKKKSELTDTSYTTGYYMAFSMIGDVTCGSQVNMIVGTGLGVCNLISSHLDTYIYATTDCSVDTSTNQVTISSNQFDDDGTCIGTPGTTVNVYTGDLCEGTDTGVSDTSFLDCASSSTAYNAYPGYTCIYWYDTPDCNPAEIAYQWSSYPNGNCDEASTTESIARFYDASTGYETNYYYATQDCSGAITNTTTNYIGVTTGCQTCTGCSFSSICNIIG